MIATLTGTVEANLLILLTIVLAGPIVAERLHLPGIIGLIFGGTLFGPFVLGWIEATGLVTDLGAIGILYLMFLTGVTFDIRAFIENRRSAITYGLLGFFVPFLITAFVMIAIFDLGLLPSALIGAMWASNTLVAYPEVQSAGLQNNRAVSASVSAGVVADLLSLLVLAAATATAVIESDPIAESFDGSGFDVGLDDAGVLGGELAELAIREIQPSTPDPTLPLYVALPLLVVFCLWILPKLAGWFFVRVGRSRMNRFVFALAGMAAGACVALMGGIEGLIGAFLAGLGLNRLVPTKGPLMERLEFVGAAIFVPTFLVSIGLNIDPVLLIDPATLVLGGIFASFVLVGKAISATITGLVFKFSFHEVGLMSSLSFGQAASTLAIAQVGLSLGMFEQIVVNASIIAIVITALVTSIGTRWFASRVPRVELDELPLGSNVLIDIRSDAAEDESLTALAAAIAAGDDGLVRPFAITEPGSLPAARAAIETAVAELSAAGLDADGIVRVDDSFASGTGRIVEEHDASLVIVRWSGPRPAQDYLFGNDIDAIGRASPVPTMAVRLLRPWSRIVVLCGDLANDRRRTDARLAVETARRARTDDEMAFVGVATSADVAAEIFGEIEDVEVVVAASLDDAALAGIRTDDLVVLCPHVWHDLRPVVGWRPHRSLDDANLVVVAGPHRLTLARAVAFDPLRMSLPLADYDTDPAPH